MAENAARFARGVAGYLGRTLGIEAEFVDDVPWQERERRLYSGSVHVCWLCGLPYVRERDSDAPRIELLAAPVPRPDRYRGEAVYFSDVIVRETSEVTRFTDLAGRSIAYNEPNSHSGYNVLRHACARAGLRPGCFSGVVESGAHRVSIELVLAGAVEAAAIDSTVLEAEIANRPEIRGRIRTVEILGPSAMPPWVAHIGLPAAFRRDVREALLAMAGDAEGARILAAGDMERFAPVAPQWYDAILEMERTAAAFPLVATRRVMGV